jgi:hypothetical protein
MNEDGRTENGCWPPSLAERVDAICDHFETAWKAGQRPRIEAYLDEVPKPERTTLLQELLALELELRVRSGETPLRHEYHERFPEQLDVIDTLFKELTKRGMLGNAREAPDESKPDPHAPSVQMPFPAPSQPPQIPSRIGRYDVQLRLGGGTFGDVYLAYDGLMDRRVAIKVPSATLLASQTATEEFLREARSVARLQHEGIVRAYDFGQDADGQCYIVYEYVEGTTLAERIKPERSAMDPLPQALAATMVAQVAEALHYAHLQGLVHRDIKPANILLDRQGKPKVADFGLAVREEDLAKQKGRLAGTLPYMSPEQVRREAHRIDGRTDIYSLGVVLYELLCRRRPFQGETEKELKEQILHREAKPPRQINDSIPRVLEDICLKALSKRINDRYATARDMAEELWEVAPHVQRLARLPVGAEDSEMALPPDPDHELPEVQHEQAFHLRTFAGREEFLKAVAHWIDEQAEGGYLLLLGPPGQGKSALVAELARREGERQGCLLHMIKSHRNPLRFLPALISQSAKLARVRFGAEAYRGDLDDLRNAMVRALEAVRDRTGRALLLIDALDELEHFGERTAFLPRSLPEGVRVVLTCRPEIPLLQALRTRLQRLEEWQLPPLTEEDLPLVLERWLGWETPLLQALRVCLQAPGDWQVPPLTEGLPPILQRWLEVGRRRQLVGMIDRLYGNPLLLQRALQRITQEVTKAQHEGRPFQVDLDTLPGTLEDLFRDIYNEIGEREGTRFRSAEGRHKARLLQFLCLAREALGFEQLAGLMAVDGTPLSREDCRDRVLEVSAYLLDTGGGRFEPWHHGLVDYVCEHVLGDAGCQRIEELFSTWLDRLSVRVSPYALRHAASHLAAARQFDRLVDILTDWNFLESKVRAGMASELARDFRESIRCLPPSHPHRHLVAALHEAIARDLCFLARRPESLFQSLWNQCWWYDSPEAAKRYGATDGGWPLEGPPWERCGPRLCLLLEEWHKARKQMAPEHRWVRSIVPPARHLCWAAKGVYTETHSDLLVHALSYSDRGLLGGLTFTVDGRAILFLSEGDRTARAWDVATWTELASYKAHKPLSAVAFSGHDWHVALSCRDQTLTVVDMHTGQEIVRLFPLPVTRLAFAPHGRRLVGSHHHLLYCWELGRGGEPVRLSGHSGTVCAFAFSPDGRLLASGSEDRTIRLWDLEAGTELMCFRGHAERVWHVSFAQDGRRLASGSEDRTVRVWNLDTPGGSIMTSGFRDWVTRVAFSPDGRHLVIGVADGTLWRWELTTGACREIINGICDLEAIAAGSDRFPWWAVSGDVETVIEQAGTRVPVAWLPQTFHYLTTHPSGRTWAGIGEGPQEWEGPEGKHLHLFTLESQ